MKLALTMTNKQKFNPSYFEEENFKHETAYARLGASSLLMDPGKVLNALGLNSDYEHTPPFCYIRSYAPIWEYYLIALNYEDLEQDVYELLRGTPAKNKWFKYFGSGRAVGNRKYDDWKNNYNRLIHNDLFERERIRLLSEETKVFADLLVNNKSPIRQCPIKDFENPRNSKLIQARKKAACAFLNFLIEGQVGENELELLMRKSNMYNRFKWLIRHFKDVPNSYRHMLSVAFLYCLYGKRDSEIPCDFFVFVKKEISTLTENEIQKQVCNLFDSALANSKDGWVKPPLVEIYEERDRLSLQKRIGIWLHLLKGVIDAQNEPA